MSNKPDSRWDDVWASVRHVPATEDGMKAHHLFSLSVGRVECSSYILEEVWNQADFDVSKQMFAYLIEKIDHHLASE